MDARIAEQAQGREVLPTEDQLRAVRAAAKVIATLSPSDAGPQVKRLCGILARYGWSPREISQAAIMRRGTG